MSSEFWCLLSKYMSLPRGRPHRVDMKLVEKVHMLTKRVSIRVRVSAEQYELPSGIPRKQSGRRFRRRIRAARGRTSPPLRVEIERPQVVVGRRRSRESTEYVERVAAENGARMRVTVLRIHLKYIHRFLMISRCSLIINIIRFGGFWCRETLPFDFARLKARCE